MARAGAGGSFLVDGCELAGGGIHAVLFDGSAGEGIAPGEWPKPLAGHACGYAGGLNPDNMQKNLDAISRATPDTYSTWVDQETGARTDNKFDLTKVERVLEITAPYAETPAAVRAPKGLKK